MPVQNILPDFTDCAIFAIWTTHLKFGVRLFFIFPPRRNLFSIKTNTQNNDIRTLLDDMEIARRGVTSDVKTHFLINKCKSLHMTDPFILNFSFQADFCLCVPRTANRNPLRLSSYLQYNQPSNRPLCRKNDPTKTAKRKTARSDQSPQSESKLILRAFRKPPCL